MPQKCIELRSPLRACLDILQLKGSMTITELKEILAIPRPTVARYVKQLVDLGLVYRIKYLAQTGLSFRYSVSRPAEGQLDDKLRICLEAVIIHGSISARELARILEQPITTVADHLKKLYSLGLLFKSPYRGRERTSYKYEVWLFSQ